MRIFYKEKLLEMREMNIGDISEVLSIEQQSHSHPWSKSHFSSSIASSHQCYVLLNKFEIAGYIITSTAADEAELLNITIAPDYQRQGLAKQLLTAIFGSFDISIQTLFLEVRESNMAAIALYDSLGFNEVGVRENYYPVNNPVNNKGREDAIIMAKSLC